MLDLPGAWALLAGAGVTVAVVDSGLKLDHPDLAPNVWTNFREVPGNGVDDDGNGYVDDVHGVDLTTTSRAPGPLATATATARTSPGSSPPPPTARGVVGVAPQAKIMTVKVLDADGAGTTGAVAEGIRYAAANGARIINAQHPGRRPRPAAERRDRRRRRRQRAGRRRGGQRRARHRQPAVLSRRRSRRRT